jgi:hypothetical protein
MIERVVTLRIRIRIEHDAASASPPGREVKLAAFWHDSSQEVPMKNSRFPKAQIASILKEADAGATVQHVSRRP